MVMQNTLRVNKGYHQLAFRTISSVNNRCGSKNVYMGLGNFVNNISIPFSNIGSSSGNFAGGVPPSSNGGGSFGGNFGSSSNGGGNNFSGGGGGNFSSSGPGGYNF